MEREEFKYYRHKLNRTQETIAQLIGVSVKAIRSYEQGWRRIPSYVERQLLFLVALKEYPGEKNLPCWNILNCPEEQKKSCPAWEFNAGSWCWAINGTICCGSTQGSWEEKMKICKNCKAFPAALKPRLIT